MQKIDNKAIALADSAWESCRGLRERRERYKRFTYGDQWGDRNNKNGETDGEVAESLGYKPITNNLIRQLVKSVTGLYRRDMAEPSSGIDATTAEMNEIEEIDARTLEEFLISGCAVQRVTTEKRIEGEGIWVDIVSPARFFVNPFQDPRGHDIEVIGMIHEMSLKEVMMRFGEGKDSKKAEIRLQYSNMNGEEWKEYRRKGVRDERCEVVELWTLEGRELIKGVNPESGEFFTASKKEEYKLQRENLRRRNENRETIPYREFTSLRWHCKWLTPWGYVLKEYDSPWPHGKHPFAVKFFPLTDGEVHSFVEDVTEQQKSINRMITLIDKIMSVSAKGALLFPTDRKPDNYTWSEIGESWSKPGGIIPYKSSERSGEPHQISGGGDQSGATALLDIEMRMLEQVSGVTGALQGRDTTSNTSAALYDAKTKNATTALIDVLESFRRFIKTRNKLIFTS